MTDDIAIEREEAAGNGRWFVRFDDGTEGEMTYRRVNDKVIAVNHTGVPPQHRGGGMALKLVQAGIDAARSEGFKIIPLCSYVDAQFRRHPDWADLRED